MLKVIQYSSVTSHAAESSVRLQSSSREFRYVNKSHKVENSARR